MDKNRPGSVIKAPLIGQDGSGQIRYSLGQRRGSGCRILDRKEFRTKVTEVMNRPGPVHGRDPKTSGLPVGGNHQDTTRLAKAGPKLLPRLGIWPAKRIHWRSMSKKDGWLFQTLIPFPEAGPPNSTVALSTANPVQGAS